MRLYTLQVNNETVIQVDAELPSWLPRRPRLNLRWLRNLLASSLRELLLDAA